MVCSAGIGRKIPKTYDEKICQYQMCITLHAYITYIPKDYRLLASCHDNSYSESGDYMAKNNHFPCVSLPEFGVT